jgi:hypothetical protein
MRAGHSPQVRLAATIERGPLGCSGERLVKIRVSQVRARPLRDKQADLRSHQSVFCPPIPRSWAAIQVSPYLGARVVRSRVSTAV